MAVPTKARTFPEVVEQMVATYRAKNSDYSDSATDPFRNFRFAELAGISAFDGALTRLSDKFIRVMNLRKKEKEGREVAVKSESIKDTLLDMANYAIISLVLYEQEEEADAHTRAELDAILEEANAPATPQWRVTTRYTPPAGDGAGGVRPLGRNFVSPLHPSQREGAVPQQEGGPPGFYWDAGLPRYVYSTDDDEGVDAG